MKKTLNAITIMAALTISLISCQREKQQAAPTQNSSSREEMKTMSDGVAMDMPVTGVYKAWIENAIVTTNPARLDNFIASFSKVEPQSSLLTFTMVNVTVDGLGQGSIGVICDLKDPDVPMDGGIYTTPTGEKFRYGWVLGNNGFWYPGKFWLIGNEWVFFPFDHLDQQDANMYPYDSGIDMDNLAIFRNFKANLKYA